MNTLRVDVDNDTDPFILNYQKKIESYIKGKYYFQFELGKVTEKPHIQGYAIHDKKVNTFRDHMNKWLRDNRPSSCAAKAHAPVRDIKCERSYVHNNECKLDLPKFWTNYSSEELEAFCLETPVFLEKSKFLEAKKIRVKVKTWSDLVFDRMEEFCIDRDLHQCKIIQYDLLVAQMYGLPKSLNYHIFKNNLLGLTKRLEEKYPHHKNKRVTHLFRDSVKNDPEINIIYDLKQ